MDETKTETAAHTTEKAVVVQELPKELEKTEAGVKIYPTSFLPQKSKMEPSRIPTAKMTGLEIEIIHVVIFFVLTFCLFYSMWQRPNKR